MQADIKEEEKQSISVICTSKSSLLRTPDVVARTSKSFFRTRKFKILASIVYGNLFLGSCYSLMAPFFPAEAEHKGTSATERGIIFGVYELTMFFSSPIYGKLVPKLRPGFMMKVGMLVSGICSILFGTLKYAPAGTPFVALALTIRIVDALGASAFITACYTTLGCELPDIIGRAMSVVETAFAFGLAGGPVIGGFLYQAGGFSLPFYTVGGFLLTGTAMNCFLFCDSDNIITKPCSMRKIMSNIDFMINVVAIFICFASMGFNESTLEPHIRQFNLSPSIVGCIFLISGIVDAIVAPIWGWFAEKSSNALKLTFLACIMLIICFVIIGPLPFLHLPTFLWVVIISQFMLGFGMSGEVICSFTHGMRETVKHGFPDDESTYGLVAGILFSAGCAGGFIGPASGGILIDHFQYEYSTAFIVILQIIVALLIGSRLIWLNLRSKDKKEVDRICAPEFSKQRV